MSELGPEDSGRNIVEIIFKSSWRQQRQSPVGMGAAMCQIERILKVHNPARTVARFESYRDAGAAGDGAGSARAMLVCRVIAGQVRKAGGEEEGLFDSVAGEEDGGGAYGSMEELFVANPRAILPCFVVIYRVAAPSC